MVSAARTSSSWHGCICAAISAANSSQRGPRSAFDQVHLMIHTLAVVLASAACIWIYRKQFLRGQGFTIARLPRNGTSSCNYKMHDTN